MLRGLHPSKQGHILDNGMFNCGLISLLEIGCIFPLIGVDINELMYLRRSKGKSIGLVTSIFDSESQPSKEVMYYIL